jgi:hypothetical protein
MRMAVGWAPGGKVAGPGWCRNKFFYRTIRIMGSHSAGVALHSTTGFWLWNAPLGVLKWGAGLELVQALGTENRLGQWAAHGATRLRRHHMFGASAF